MGKVLRLPSKHRRPEAPHLLGGFMVAPELRDWTRAVFIEDGGPLTNPDHAHLLTCKLEFVWTGEENNRAGRRVLGQTELMPPMAMGKWQRGRAIHQVEEWFGVVPDFLITIDATTASMLDDASFCALIEHELYHCAQKLDRYGQPMFDRDTGEPKFAIRGHDVEEFTGVVARYGTEATGTTRMVEAANRGPTVATASISAACGTCALGRKRA